ncbi:MAG: DUF1987 domain-containing protein [Bacteroidetes bacterium]|nr:DUF1987 domain-containing protein [Bacteroidota bacterium]
MENLLIEGSAKTPTVNFNSEAGVIELKGRSIPENSVEFYQPLNEWIELYAKSPKLETVVEIKLEYFNTSSSKCILDLFKKLESMNNSSTQVKVNWYFEEDDEDMEEAGEDYQAIIGLPFNMIEVDEI